MKLLIFTTLLWAFSFSLIGEFLAGSVSPSLSALTRIALATLLFIPFIFKEKLLFSLRIKLMSIGAIQLGFMYLFYYKSFLLLSVPEVLIFTIFTPLYVTLLNDILRKQFKPIYLLAAFLAVTGTAIIRYTSLSEHFIQGFIYIQLTNLCFAFGQVAYKKLIEKESIQLSQHSIFGYFYLGALIVSAINFILTPQIQYPTEWSQYLVLTWLGLIASGLGYFMWNKGATQVNAGTLAVMNNALIPVGLLVNLCLWGKSIDLLRTLTGSLFLLIALVICEWILRHKSSQNPDLN